MHLLPGLLIIYGRNGVDNHFSPVKCNTTCSPAEDSKSTGKDTVYSLLEVKTHMLFGDQVRDIQESIQRLYLIYLSCIVDMYSYVLTGFIGWWQIHFPEFSPPIPTVALDYR